MTEPELAGDVEIGQAIEGILGLAAGGIDANDFIRYLGLEPEAVRRYALEVAEEKFRTLPGLPSTVDATGRLRKLNLSANQRQQVKDALEETALLSIQLGAILAISRLRAQVSGQEEEVKQHGD